MGNLHRKLTIKHLRLISVLGRELNMSKAAEILHTSLPGLSRSLAQIEQQLDLVLFDRTTRSMQLTNAGKSLYRYANIILYQLDQAEDELEGLAYGRLSIGIIPAFSSDVLAKAIHRIQSMELDVKIEIKTGEADDLFHQLIDGSLDVMLSHAQFSANLELVSIHELYQEESAIVCSPSNDLVKKASLSVADITSSPWILPKTDTPLRAVLNRSLFVDRPKMMGKIVDIEVDSYAQSLSILKDSAMLTILPKQLANWYEALGVVRQIQAPISLLKGPMCSITSKKASLSKEVMTFLDLINEQANGLS